MGRGANVNDVTQNLALVDGISPAAGRPDWPGRRPEALLGDKGYDSNAYRDELRRRRILPVISRKGSQNIQGMGKLRYVVEPTFALLHRFKRLAVRRRQLHDAFAALAFSPHRLARASAAQERLSGVRGGQDISRLLQHVDTHAEDHRTLGRESTSTACCDPPPISATSGWRSSGAPPRS
ncbi:transposase [Streptomyces sp. NPDC047043]|uniref:transposase n=1 Tax=Streptomyces sp. NPDC047043 TaxID=3154497 RepID=UPI0033C62CFD